MNDVRMYRRKDDPTKVYTVVRYGNEGRDWDQDCVARVAKFVLGLDVNTRVTIANERIYDVVRPVEERWNPERWLADISVADWPRGITYQLAIGDWLLKDEQGILSHVKPLEFSEQFEFVPKEKAAYTRLNELTDLIYENIPWDGGVYMEFAEGLAEKIIRDGWTKN